MALEPTSGASQEPFLSARLKIRRAKMHLAELELLISAYLESKPISIIVEQPDVWKKLGSCAWVCRVTKTIDPMCSAIIGDSTHNLRTALDLLATDLVRLNGGNWKNVYFPFSKNADELPGQIKDKNFRRAAVEIVEFLSKSVRPYAGGNDALRGLHDLDILDKHQALIPAISTVKIPKFDLYFGSNKTNIPQWHSVVSFDGQTLMVMPELSNVPAGSEIGADFDVVFGPGQPFSGVPVREALRSLCEYIPRIVDAFASLCRGQQFPEEIST